MIASKSRKKTKSHRSLGILLLSVAAVLLVAIGIFLTWKWSAAPSLAKILPRNETPLFFEIRTQKADFADLQKFYDDAAETLELDSLGLARPQNLLALTADRIGVGFVGRKFDPQKSVLVIEVEDSAAAKNFFENELLGGSNFSREKIGGAAVYNFPQISATAALRGDDLIFAPDRETLETILTADAVVASDPAFHAALRKNSPLNFGFGFADARFLDTLVNSNFGGISRAVALPFTQIWQSAALALATSPDGVTLTVDAILRDEFSRSQFFANVEPVDSEIFKFFGEETKKLFASRNFGEQISQIFESTEKYFPTFEMLARGSLASWTQNFFGEAIDFETEIAPLLDDQFAVAKTTNGGFEGVFIGAVATDQLLKKFATGDGLLAAREADRTLRDGSAGRELSTARTIPSLEKFEIEGLAAWQLTFPRQKIFIANLADKTAFASSRELLTKMIDRTLAGNVGLQPIFETIEISAENIFFARLADDRPPLLAPFEFAISGIHAVADGLEIKTFFGI